MTDYIKREDAIKAFDWTGDQIDKLARKILSDEKLLPSADVVEVVRCKDCKYRENRETWFACTYWNADPYEQPTVNDNDFCSYGERK